MKDIIINVLILITFDFFWFAFGQKKYRNYVTLKHYIQTLKMPIYQRILTIKIIIVVVLTIIFEIFSR